MSPPTAGPGPLPVPEAPTSPTRGRLAGVRSGLPFLRPGTGSVAAVMTRSGGPFVCTLRRPLCVYPVFVSGFPNKVTLPSLDGGPSRSH